MREFLTAFFRFAVSRFYRRVEIVGLAGIPADRGVIFAANHPNGLVDPLFILCFAPRPVSFLAKAPLFRYPLIGWFVRQLDSIPVYRKQDATAGSNQETFAIARQVLARRGCIAIFPEGTTHSDPRLRELKTGAARIALGAASSGLAIVPVGINYSAKQTFRSSAVVTFGDPIAVTPCELDEGGEPAAVAVDELTAAIRRGLDAVTLQADSAAALDLVVRAERIFSSDAETSAAAEFQMRRRFIDGYHYLCGSAPARLARLTSMVEQFESERDAANLDPETLEPQSAGQVFTALAVVLVILPIAALGALLNFPAYRLVAFLSALFAKGESEMAATMKFIGALLFYPLLWIAEAFIAYRFFGGVAAAAVAIGAPIAGWVALRAAEAIDTVIGRVRSLTRRFLAAHAMDRLTARRDAIRSEILAIAEEMGVAG